MTPDEKLAQILPLVAAGQSYSQIGEQLGLKRNSVAGLLNRHRRLTGQPVRQQIPGGAVSTKQQKPRQARAKVQPEASRPIVLPPKALADTAILRSRAWDALPGSLPIPLAGHTSGCRWPIGDQRWPCNEPAPDSVYCPAHRALAYKPLPKDDP